MQDPKENQDQSEAQEPVAEQEARPEPASGEPVGPAADTETQGE